MLDVSSPYREAADKVSRGIFAVPDQDISMVRPRAPPAS